MDNIIAKEKMLATPANHKVWRKTVQNVFEKEDLWDCLVPVEDEDGDIEEESQPPTRQEIVTARKRRVRAIGLLNLTLCEGPQDFIEGITDPREAWLKLNALYSTQTIADIMTLRNKWHDCRMTDDMDVPTFMQVVYGLLRDLRAADQVMDDPTVVHKILTHLPNRFEHFVRQVQSERTLPTLDELFRLHLEKSNLKLRHGNNHEEALVMRIRNVIMNRGRGGPPRFTRGETSREQFICHRCGKPVHTARVCQTPAPLPSNFVKSATYPNQAAYDAHYTYLREDSTGEPDSLSEVTEDGIETALAALSLENVSENPKDFIVDSGASRHFASDPTMFSKLEQNSSSRTVKSASGFDHVIRGQGEIDIAQSSGEVNTIKGVKYVPGLSKNLLSVGQITDCHNLVIFSKTRGLVITDSSPFTKVDVGVRDIHNGLYRLTSLHSNLEAHLLEPPKDVEAHPLFTPELLFDQLLETHVAQNLPISQPPVSIDNKHTKITEAQNEQIRLWHARMGHISFANLSLLSRMCIGMPTLPESPEVCRPMSIGKENERKNSKSC